MKKAQCLAQVASLAIFLNSCISPTEYNQLRASKDRMSRNLFETEQEVRLLSGKTSELIGRLESQSKNMNEMGSKIAFIEESYRRDSVELIMYRAKMVELRDELRACEKSNTKLVEIYEDKIKKLNLQYLYKINAYNLKLKKERSLRYNMLSKLKADYERKLLKYR